ncbi:MAG: hypothetical protein HYS08_06655 [Chlamydiae bacterium]|nr:hypothetical protein [Chlamydiota bacterium]MBI3267075.1 hypothetical protein [Chlamydiota bacterium]
MKLFKWMGVAYVAVILTNLWGCEAPHEHHTDVMNETVVEQTEVVE